MYKYEIDGGNKLEGNLTVSGSKNATLPILAASILNDEETILYGIPEIEDVKITLEILKKLGCEIKEETNKITIDSGNINNEEIPSDLMKKLRSSIIIVGALIAKLKKVRFSYPGGCNIGNRPIDLHINNFKKLGVKVIEEENTINCDCNHLISQKINLEFPSVGATENLILVSVLGNQEIVIENAAEEPEIVDLANFLNKMGAKVYGAGTSVIKIIGVSKLKKVEYKVIPDRIEAGTLLVATAITGGEIKLDSVIPDHLTAVIDKLKEMKCLIDIQDNIICLKANKRLKAANIITEPYPGFPTDLQQIFSSLLTVCDGTSIITENIFENRFGFANELKKMGANIQISNKKMIIEGIEHLDGSIVNGADLRGTTALVIAGLVANGTTTVKNIEYLLRGYECLDYKLNSIGAKIKRKEEN